MNSSHNSFSHFNLLPSLAQTLKEKGLTKPTEIQSSIIPLLMDGKTVVGVAETGSGKTLAYVLPILDLLKKLEYAKNPVTENGQPRACVVVPTRELGEQVSRVFKPFTHTTRLRVRTILGGTAFDVARRNVNGPFEILVATPGRLTKLMEMKLLSLSDVRILVFDEADQMLDKGFLPTANKVVSDCPPERQLALFSATVPPTVEQLMTTLFAEATVIRSVGSHRVVSSLRTVNQKVVDGRRFAALEPLIQNQSKGGTILFTNTRIQCDKLAGELDRAGKKCVVYRGEMDKIERRKNLKAFRDGEIEFLISTDLASRGLDVEHVGRVINYHLPQQMENYIHRVGRTARAGREGLVINFVTERDESFVKKLDLVMSAPKGERAKIASGSAWPSEPEHKKVAKVKPIIRIKGRIVTDEVTSKLNPLTEA